MLVEIIGKFYDNHSLSIVNRNLAIMLANKGVEVVITPIDSYDPEFKLDKLVVKTLKLLVNDSIKVPDIQVRHTYPPMWNWPLSNKTKVVYIQPWEFSKAPSEWQYKFETFADALIVPSNTNAKVFANGGLNPNNLFVVPNGYDEAIFNLNPKKPLPEVDEDKFNFVFVGNSQWRKGLDILLNVWHKSFKKYDNARLIIKDNPKVYGNSNILNEIIRMQYITGCAPITYINRDLSDIEMASLYRNSSAIVHPYRAEGFGMHIQEAVACGCVPIIPDKGPTEDFIPNEYSMKIQTKTQVMDITDPNVFALKPGDSSTLMSSHTFMNEPLEESLKNALHHLYNSHDRQKMIDKIESIDSLNTWDTAIDEYIRVFNKIKERKVNRLN